MSMYEVHTVETAPEASKPLLRNLKSTIGMIPNLAASMSESPELLNGFLTIREIFHGGSFTPGEIQVLALTNAFENGCRYCMAFHSAFALKEGISKDVVEALRTGRSPQEPTLRALSEFSRALVKHRGHVSGDDLQRFMAAGYLEGAGPRGSAGHSRFDPPELRAPHHAMPARWSLQRAHVDDDRRRCAVGAARMTG